MKERLKMKEEKMKHGCEGWKKEQAKSKKPSLERVSELMR